MTVTAVEINLREIQANTQAIVSLCRDHDVEVTGVTKATGGMPQVAHAMLRGGVTSIGESRLENIKGLRANGVNAPIMLLRIPPLSSVGEVVTTSDISLNSEFRVIKALSAAAERHELVHDIIIMIDLGDLREGVWAEDVELLTESTLELPGVRIVGVGTNLTCYGGVLPSQRNMSTLLKCANLLERRFNLNLRYISGGNSSSLPLLASGNMPSEINHLRIGEAILLGRETINRSAWPGTYQDAFLLRSELIELKMKPSVPVGEIGQNAFGQVSEFKDDGIRKRGIVNLGRVDLDVDGLRPVDLGISMLGASSDHFLLDLTNAEKELALGETILFQMNYSALVGAMTSRYIDKIVVRGDAPPSKSDVVAVIGEERLLENFKQAELSSGITDLGYKVTTTPIKGPELRALSDCDNIDAPSIEITDYVYQAIAKVVPKRHLPLLVNSDREMAIAAIQSIADQGNQLGVIWLDATPSLFSAKLEEPDPPKFSQLIGSLGCGDADENLDAQLLPDNVTLVGLRKAKRLDAKLVAKFGIKTFTMEDVDVLGIREVMRQCLRRASAGTSFLFVYFAPAVLANRHDPDGAVGLTYREAFQLMEMISDSGLLRGLAIGNAKIDRNVEPLSEHVSLVLSCLGKKILGAHKA